MARSRNGIATLRSQSGNQTWRITAGRMISVLFLSCLSGESWVIGRGDKTDLPGYCRFCLTRSLIRPESGTNMLSKTAVCWDLRFCSQTNRRGRDTCPRISSAWTGPISESRISGYREAGHPLPGICPRPVTLSASSVVGQVDIRYSDPVSTRYNCMRYRFFALCRPSPGIAHLKWLPT